jgi:MFS family permease
LTGGRADSNIERTMLKNRNCVLLIAVSFVAGFGNTAMSLTAAVWVKTLTGSSGLAALAGFFVFAPTLLGPVLGAVVDRFPARPVLAITNLATAALLLTLMGVHSGHQVWLIYAVMLGYGVSYVLIDAAEARLLTAALPAEALGAMFGYRMSAQEATKLFAPLVGAGIFAWAGGPAVAVISAVTLVTSAGLYLGVGQTVPSGQIRERKRRWRVAEGVRFVVTRPELRMPVLVASVAMIVSAFGNAAVYSVVESALHRPPPFVGVLSSVQGAGAIVGGLAAGRLLQRLGETGFAALGAIVFALGPLAQAVGWLPVVIAGSAFVGIGLPWAVVAALTAVQLRTPSTMLGRVAGSATTLVFAPPALGIPLGAVLVSVVDYRIQLVVGGSATLLGAAVVLGTSRARSGAAAMASTEA